MAANFSAVQFILDVNGGITMDKKMKILLLVTAVCVIVIGAASAISATTKPPLTVSQADHPSAVASTWTVGVFEGKLAVFQDGNDRPVELYEDVLISELPETDQALLRRGITAYSTQELQTILEDYTS